MLESEQQAAAGPIPASSGGVGLSSAATLRVSVTGIVQETQDTRSLILGVPLNGAQLRYQAGQFLTLEVPSANGWLRRSYSFSSSPEVDSRPVLTVKRVPGGAVSSWLHDQVSIGSVLRVHPPAGHFVLQPEENGTLLLLGAGSGITPLMSLLKSALHRSHRRIRCFYANPRAQATIFKAQLDLLAANHRERLELRYHFDDQDGTPTLATFQAQCAGFADGDVYLCGPTAFMQLAERAVKGSAASARLHVEHFGAAPCSGASVHHAMPDAVLEPARVRWRFGTDLADFTCHPGESLLHAARSAGFDPPASCEEGYCGSCRSRLLRGRVHMNASDALSSAKISQGFILPCQARPLTSELELET